MPSIKGQLDSGLTDGGDTPSRDGAVSSIKVGASRVHLNGLHVLVHLYGADQLDEGNVSLQGTTVPVRVLKVSKVYLN